MKLGVFLPNATHGFIMSTTAPALEPTYALNRDITKLCEDIGFDFAMSMIKHHGFGGPTRFWDEALDSFTLMAALAAETDRITVIPSVPILAVHPATAARQCVTISEVAEGRFALNVVTGWSRTEYAQYNLWPGEEHYRRRYEFATEYVQIMKDFWSTGHSNFKGEYFQMNDATVLPVPPARDIPLVCAGRSDEGMRFTAKMGEYNFVMGSEAQLRDQGKRLNAFAVEANRSIGMLPLFVVFIAPTDEEAQESYQHVLDGADHEAIHNMRTDWSLDAGAGTGGTAQVALEQSVFFGQTPLIGSYESIAETLNRLSSKDVAAGFMLTFPDYMDGLTQFGEHVMPRLSSGAVA